MTDTGSWLKVQNGQRPFQSERPDPQIRYLRNARDLAEYVHNDVLFQEYLNAALMLATMHAPLNSRNPYDNLRSETGFITFGLPMVHVLVAEVIARALKHTWLQKWFVHRMARPEETGGLVHFTLTGQKQYPLDATLLQSQAVHQVFSRTGAYLLPHSYPEGVRSTRRTPPATRRPRVPPSLSSSGSSTRASSSRIRSSRPTTVLPWSRTPVPMQRD